MYKVLIADDESIIRTALAEAFQWEKYGMEVVGLCKNGLEALELVKTEHPDICLLDIQMPLLSGLALIEKINEIDEDIINIIITGHDEFEYARTAIRLGVYNYILKPIEEDEFVEMLIKIKEELDNRSLTKENQLRKDKILNESREVLRDEFLNEWICGTKNNLKVEEFLKDFDIHFAQNIGMVYVHISYPVGILEKERLKQEQLYKCRERLDKHFYEDKSYCFIKLFSNRFVLLFNAEDSERWDNIKIELEQVICTNNNRWKIFIQKKLVKTDFENIPQVFAALSEESKKELMYLPVVNRVKRHVEENYQDMNLRLSAFAKANRISMSYLSKLFKNETGVSFIDYLIRFRIKKSLELLNETNFKIREISERVGYSSQHYYCEAFKKVMDMTPTEYRRKKYKRDVR